MKKGDFIFLIFQILVIIPELTECLKNKGRPYFELRGNITCNTNKLDKEYIDKIRVHVVLRREFGGKPIASRVLDLGDFYKRQMKSSTTRKTVLMELFGENTLEKSGTDKKHHKIRIVIVPSLKNDKVNVTDANKNLKTFLHTPTTKVNPRGFQEVKKHCSKRIGKTIELDQWTKSHENSQHYVVDLGTCNLANGTCSNSFMYKHIKNLQNGNGKNAKARKQQPKNYMLQRLNGLKNA
ncbi:hypothetical protein DdX_19000 [Ditylenchus destructor]|uniref:Uncharacterized protein n=1 Tax=Ditylenchus destructor TaxID=166010 RepID=A0AAD4QXM4_9BILA|nr:hypothetical protein DdX_19000 [Ditylenchus destructor]